jgi:DNA-binding transcriptional ArsR family regulator
MSQASKVSMKEKAELNEEALAMIASRFRQMADPLRLKILYTLGDGEMNVTDLVKATGAGQANVSKQLSTLLSAQIVARRKEGLNAIYRVSDETIFKLCEVVCSSLKDQLKTRHDTLVGL